MAEPTTDEIIATSRELLNDSVETQDDSGETGETVPVVADVNLDDSLMDSESPNEDSLNDTSDSVGDTYQAVSYVSKTQKRLFPSDCPPPCTMDPDKGGFDI